VVSRSVSDYDIESAHREAEVDDAVVIVESPGDDRGYVIGEAGVYDLVLSRRRPNGVQPNPGYTTAMRALSGLEKDGINRRRPHSYTPLVR